MNHIGGTQLVRWFHYSTLRRCRLDGPFQLVLEFKKVVYDRPLRLETQLASKLCNELQLRFEICSAQSRALQLPQLQYNAEISSKNVFSR